MNSLDRAKQFLKNKASRLAVAIAPLAAVAVAIPAAHAGLVTVSFDQTALCSAGAASGSATCATEQVSSTGGNPIGNWVAFFGTGSSNGGSSSWIDFGISGGSASGSLGVTSIPVSWLFDISSPSSGSVTYTVDFSVGLTPSGSKFTTFDFSDTETVASNAHVSGSGAIQVLTGGILGQYTATLNTSGNVNYSINIPGGTTVDFNSAVAPAPEPATLLMVPGGLAVLYLKRRKKR